MQLNYDFFIVITGDEGTGKSRGIMLNIIDCWYNQILCRKPDHLPFVGSFLDYPELLNKSQPFDIAALDEAGDSLDNTQIASKLKNMLYRSYTVIREKRLFSIIVLPSIFELYTNFARRRVRMLIHSDKRTDSKCLSCGCFFVGLKCPKCGSTEFKAGKVYFLVYRRKALQTLLDINKDEKIKRLSWVQPTATGVVREYKGEWIEDYNIIKTDKTQSALQSLLDEVAKIHSKKENNPRKCPNCGSTQTRWNKKNNIMVCRNCPHEWQPM